MNEKEITILKGLLDLKIDSIVSVRTNIELDQPNQFVSFGELQISFADPKVRYDRIYVGIKPRPWGGDGKNYFFLTQWIYTHKPLAESLYYPQQNIDSKFKSGFGCSFLGTVKHLLLFAYPGNSSLLRLECENGCLNLKTHDHSAYIDVDGAKSLSMIEKEYFGSEKGEELLNI